MFCCLWLMYAYIRSNETLSHTPQYFTVPILTDIEMTPLQYTQILERYGWSACRHVIGSIHGWTSGTLQLITTNPQSQSQSSRTHFNMRRNHQTSNLKPFKLPTLRRTYASTPSKRSGTGTMHQTLINDIQQPHSNSSSLRKPFTDLTSSAHGEDAELDAFGECADLSSWRVLMQARLGTSSLGG